MKKTENSKHAKEEGASSTTKTENNSTLNA
jgi:hypothetical protein